MIGDISAAGSSIVCLFCVCPGVILGLLKETLSEG